MSAGDGWVRDEAGRIVAPAQSASHSRPAGPWDTNSSNRGDTMTAKETRALPIGTPVYCTVRGSGAAGWWTLTAVRPRDGYIKIAGLNMWCPPHNFSLTEPNRG